MISTFSPTDNLEPEPSKTQNSILVLFQPEFDIPAIFRYSNESHNSKGKSDLIALCLSVWLPPVYLSEALGSIFAVGCFK